jgi:hypothetical protein
MMERMRNNVKLSRRTTIRGIIPISSEEKMLTTLI